MCQKRSQPDGSDVPMSAQGWGSARLGCGEASCSRQPLADDGASPLTPELLGEAGAAVAGRCQRFLEFSNQQHLFKGTLLSSNPKCQLLPSSDLSIEAPQL